MTILFELSESIIKQSALIASKYPDRSLLSIIEECFNYGVKSLYSDSPKPVPPRRTYEKEDYFNSPIEVSTLESIQSTVNFVTEQAKQDLNGTVYNEDELPESLSDPIINSDGSFEF